MPFCDGCRGAPEPGLPQISLWHSRIAGSTIDFYGPRRPAAPPDDLRSTHDRLFTASRRRRVVAAPARTASRRRDGDGGAPCPEPDRQLRVGSGRPDRGRRRCGADGLRPGSRDFRRLPLGRDRPTGRRGPGPPGDHHRRGGGRREQLLQRPLPDAHGGRDPPVDARPGTDPAVRGRPGTPGHRCGAGRDGRGHPFGLRAGSGKAAPASDEHRRTHHDGDVTRGDRGRRHRGAHRSGGPGRHRRRRARAGAGGELRAQDHRTERGLGGGTGRPRGGTAGRDASAR